MQAAQCTPISLEAYDRHTKNESNFKRIIHTLIIIVFSASFQRSEIDHCYLNNLIFFKNANQLEQIWKPFEVVIGFRCENLAGFNLLMKTIIKIQINAVHMVINDKLQQQQILNHV